MKIKRLKLKNIRSYKEETVEFSEGINFISGDIGSGKSTILLAIEFALFGLVDTKIDANGLLRHGSSEGEVELTIEVGGKEFIIGRRLKKSKKGVKQDNGYIIQEDVKTSLSPLEIKSKVFEILGYEQSLISRNKNNLFRYTIYIQQEQMKSILYESADNRIEILRKLFNLDKYKIAADNAHLFLKELKYNIKNLEEQIKEEGEIKEEVVKVKENKLKIEDELRKLKEGLLEVEKKFLEEKNKVEEQNKKIEEVRKKYLEYKKIEERLRINERRLNKLLERKKEYEDKIKILKERVVGNIEEEIKKIEEKIKEYEEKRKKGEEVINKIKGKIESINYLLEEKKKNVENIKDLEHCPFCSQKISQEHKEKIKNEYEDFKRRKNNEIKELLDKKESIEKKVKKIEEAIKELKDKKKELEGRKVDKKELEMIIKNREELVKEEKDLVKEIDDLRREFNYLRGIEEQLGEMEKKKRILEEELEKIRMKLGDYEVEVKEREVLLRNFEERLKELEEKLKKIEEKKKVLEKNIQVRDWIREFFMPLMEELEKIMLARIRIEFEYLFKEWFSKLIEDESFDVSITESFEPVIIQEGFETNINYLSGGEKTSVALAYRLALNKILSEMIHNLATRGLLILDEPTDGFSSEQLDKVREIFQTLDVEQLILVSHEEKLGSIANKIIKIVKRDNVSKVLE